MIGPVPDGTVVTGTYGRADPSHPPRGWSHLVAEQLEEMGWAAGLLRALGESLGGTAVAEARVVGTTLARHSDKLVTIQKGPLLRVQRLIEEAPSRRLRREEWQFVGEALRAAGQVMRNIAAQASEAARRMPTLEGELRLVPGEILHLAHVVGERGSQMRRLGDRLLALTEGELLALSSSLVAMRKTAP